MEFNFVMVNEHWTPETEKALFQFQPGESARCGLIKPGMDMFDILVQCAIFKSKGEARKNWKLTGKDIPLGFTDFKGIGKMKHRITIWIPVNDKED